MKIIIIGPSGAGKDYKKLREAKELMGEQRFFDSLKELIEKYSLEKLL